MTAPVGPPAARPRHSRGRPPKVERLRRTVRSVKMTQAEFDALCVIAARNRTTVHGLLRVAVRRLISCLSSHPANTPEKPSGNFG